MSLSRSFSRSFFALSLSLFAVLALAAKTINVPADYATIQAAINAASNGDTILVADGTYTENIDFKGKAITVKSANGSATTIIDGGALDTVVKFQTNETSSSVLDGFTIRNGAVNSSSTFSGSGIYVNSSSPTIVNNVIKANGGCQGSGIDVQFGSPLIQGNTITQNSQSGCVGGTGGGGILLGGAAQAQILNNTISQNSMGVDGGGISLFAAGTPTIRGNTITANTSGGNGGGIAMANQSDAVVTDNIFQGNTALHGGGIATLVPSGAKGPIVVNNTFSSNSATQGGSELYFSGFPNQTQFANNIFVGAASQIAVDCDTSYSPQPPIFQFNDVFSPSGTSFAGSCTSASGTGNISVDPLFVNPASDFHLPPTSPAVDVGSNSAPNLPTQDIAGNARILDGKGLCKATVDLGAYEFVRLSSLSFNPTSLSFPSQIVGTTSSSLSSTLANTSSASSSPVCNITITGDFSQTSSCGTSIGPGASCTFNVTFAPTTTGSRTGALTVTDDAVNTPAPISLSGPGTDFALAAASGGSTSASVTAGSSATYSLQVSGVNGFSNAVSLACTGAPSLSTCTVSQASVTPGASPAPFTVTVATLAPSLVVPAISTRPVPPLAPLPFALAFVLALFLLYASRVLEQPGKRALFSSLAILLFAVLCVAACGGGGSSSPPPPSNPGTPKGSYTLTVTGTANSVNHSLSLTLSVN